MYVLVFYLHEARSGLVFEAEFFLWSWNNRVLLYACLHNTCLRYRYAECWSSLCSWYSD